MRNCKVCKKPITKDLSADGLNGFAIREAAKDQAGGEIAGRTVELEACKNCYLEHFKEKYPKEEAPKL